MVILSLWIVTFFLCFFQTYLWRLGSSVPVVSHPYNHKFENLNIGPNIFCPAKKYQIRPEKPLFDEWLHLQQIASQNETHFHQSTFLIYVANGGLGNRIQAAISSSILAFLTDRVFLLDWRKENYHPCNGHELWCIPSEMPLLHNPQRLPEIFTQQYMYSNSILLQFHAPEEVHTYLLCDHPRKTLQKFKFVFISTDEYFVPLLLYNPQLASFWRATTPEQEYSMFLHFLFQPVLQIQNRIREKQFELSERKCIIGLQYRAWGPVTQIYKHTDTRTHAHMHAPTQMHACTNTHTHIRGYVGLVIVIIFIHTHIRANVLTDAAF